ncbi:hypothetical protein ZIOFF_057476 [Zingiber officinale]|uniref:Uncharacterized protein n=1 Tax=Zingiber officinale TaxID=94328 RepID=A0A8J5KL24_ZINOF|nr:hypothetical protein ZIOFF_057476 [Zingiber officinale]
MDKKNKHVCGPRRRRRREWEHRRGEDGSGHGLLVLFFHDSDGVGSSVTGDGFPHPRILGGRTLAFDTRLARPRLRKPGRGRPRVPMRVWSWLPRALRDLWSGGARLRPEEASRNRTERRQDSQGLPTGFNTVSAGKLKREFTILPLSSIPGLILYFFSQQKNLKLN